MSVRTYQLREAVISYRRIPLDVLGGESVEADALGRVLKTGNDTARVATMLIGSSTVENMVAFAVDSRSRIASVCLISRGSQTETSPSFTEIARFAVLSGMDRLILAHNHPSGDPTPSESDREMTRAIARAMALLGIQVLDHIVVVDDPDRAMNILR